MKTLAILSTALVLASGAAVAADGTDAGRAQYDADRARCMSGATGQDQASCLKSAGAAYDAIRQKRLADPNTAYRDNALSRCNGLPSSDRADCESRVDGGGDRAGSVRGGGVVTETVTQIPAPTGK